MPSLLKSFNLMNLRFHWFNFFFNSRFGILAAFFVFFWFTRFSFLATKCLVSLEQIYKSIIQLTIESAESSIAWLFFLTSASASFDSNEFKDIELWLMCFMRFEALFSRNGFLSNIDESAPSDWDFIRLKKIPEFDFSLCWKCFLNRCKILNDYQFCKHKVVTPITLLTFFNCIINPFSKRQALRNNESNKR